MLKQIQQSPLSVFADLDYCYFFAVPYLRMTNHQKYILGIEKMFSPFLQIGQFL
jgi:hypothetical protein